MKGMSVFSQQLKCVGSSRSLISLLMLVQNLVNRILGFSNSLVIFIGNEKNLKLAQTQLSVSHACCL